MKHASSFFVLIIVSLLLFGCTSNSSDVNDSNNDGNGGSNDGSNGDSDGIANAGSRCDPEEPTMVLFSGDFSFAQEIPATSNASGTFVSTGCAPTTGYCVANFAVNAGDNGTLSLITVFAPAAVTKGLGPTPGTYSFNAKAFELGRTFFTSPSQNNDAPYGGYVKLVKFPSGDDLAPGVSKAAVIFSPVWRTCTQESKVASNGTAYYQTVCTPGPNDPTPIDSYPRLDGLNFHSCSVTIQNAASNEKYAFDGSITCTIEAAGIVKKEVPNTSIGETYEDHFVKEKTITGTFTNLCFRGNA